METVMQVADGSDSLVQRAAQVGLEDELQEAASAGARAEMSLATLFEGVASFASQYAHDRRGREDQVTLTKGARNTKEWSELESVWQTTHEELSLLAAEIENVQQRSHSLAADADAPADDEQHFDPFATKAQKLVTKLRENMKQLSNAMTEHEENTVAWAVRETRRSDLARVHAAPLSVAEMLRPLWTERHATVLTGATLTTNTEEGAAFNFLRERLGVEDATEAQYGSPFDYPNRCRIYLPTDILDANHNEHHQSVAQAIKALAVAADGRTMVLFRSYSAMKQVARLVKDDMESDGLVLLQQGRDGNAASVVQTFRNSPQSVLFGVGALWTGVDIPGDALSLLIVTRLPFDPPNDPVLKARGEQYDNAFMEFTLPEAILQFKQGIGRLIRTQTDIGAVVVLDGRITTRRYGEQFVDALPAAPVVRQAIAETARDIRQFLPPADQAK